MNKKLKKQKRKLILRICAVMLASFLVVAALLTYFTLETVRSNMYSDVDAKFETLAAELSDPNASLYYETLRSITESSASEYVYIPMSNAGAVHSDDDLADYLYGLTTQMLSIRRTGNIQIILRDISSSLSTSSTPIIDTDDNIGASFTAVENGEDKVDYSGVLSFKSFRESITDNQYEKICGYLQDSPDDEEIAYRHFYDDTNTEVKEYYQLVCTEFYVGRESTLIPKTVEIVLTDNTHDWYAQDTVVERFVLSPKESDIAGRELKVISPDTLPVIRKEFIFHTFSSDNLKKQHNLHMQKDYDLSVQIAPYHYIYANRKLLYVDTAGYADFSDMTEDELSTRRRELYLEFFYNIDVIPRALPKIAYLTGIAFLFFLTVGIILCISLWQVLKTQLKEEEKRREITRSLAHDIKTPLFIIEGYAQNLMENLHSEKRAHYAERIKERTEEVNSLIHRMLDFSKFDAEDFSRNDEDFDLSVLLDEILSRFVDIPDWKKLTVEKEESPTTADRELFRSVLLNLIDNALRYATPYSEIHIVLKDGSFSVSNACAGLSKEDLKHLTEPYYRKDESRNTTGNGLGLAVTKSILDLYQKKLSITLTDNVITFSFKLP